MDKYIISGGNTLHGKVAISGGKNAALAILPATILVNGPCIIENVPRVNDVMLMLDILKKIGAEVTFLDHSTTRIDTKNVNSFKADFPEIRKMRASYYLIGALLGRFGKAQVGMPGGCDFGSRPIDQHIKGFEHLGAKVTIEHGIVNAEAADGLHGTSIYMDVRSVGATINIMLAAVLSEGMTVIENACKEPHIVDAANFLNFLGADIKGAGTDIIKIRGVKSLLGKTYSIIPDQIEAGTYMVAVTATGGKIKIDNVIPKHLESIATKLEECGAKIEEGDDYVIVSRDPSIPIKKTTIKTMPYPGFPTDMQPQIATMLTLAKGISYINEGVWSHRFQYVDELRRMGAKASVDGQTCIIEGVNKLMGSKVFARDLRAGVAMVIAGLCAEGITEVTGVENIERGYSDLIEKLQNLGAKIKKIADSEDHGDFNAKIV